MMHSTYTLKKKRMHAQEQAPSFDGELQNANEQLQEGFALRGEAVLQDYDALFAGIESADIEEFRTLFQSMPSEVREGSSGGDSGGKVERLLSYAIDKLGMGSDRAKQFVACALAFMVASTPAFAEGKAGEEAEHPVVISMPEKNKTDATGMVYALGRKVAEEVGEDGVVTVNPEYVPPVGAIGIGEGVYVAPRGEHSDSEGRYGSIVINGAEGRVLYRDSNTVVFGNEHSTYKKGPDGTVSVGTVEISQ